VKVVSITEGIPTILPPLAFITFLTMIKDFFEDYKRRKSDAEENNKKVLIYKQSTKKWVEDLWKNVLVGDLVQVTKNQFFPCDLLCIAASDYRKGQCFIETKNLDGETNLKNKFVPADLKDSIKDDESALKLQGIVLNAEGPNQYLSKFKGYLTVADKKIPLSASNFLLRGCILRNTDYIIGLATYTGH
jgi:phospholipid-transporting ATPase